MLVDGNEVFASPVLRLKDGACAVNVPLNGAGQFEIRVKDGGDGRSYDQALWADATVKLRDGASVTLQELPLEGTGGKKLSLTEPPFSFLYDGKPSTSHWGLPAEELLKQWIVTRDTQKLDAQRTRHTLTYADSASGLQVRCVLMSMTIFPRWNGRCTSRTPAPTIRR